MMQSKLASLTLKGFFTLGLFLGAFFSSFAASAQQAAPSLPLLFDARERLARPDLSSLVRLRFLTSVDFPPFNFTDQNGKLSGFDVDLAREICSELEISDKCQIQAIPFADLRDALAASQGDAVIAGLAVTPELRRQFLFSRPYLMLPARFVRNLGVPLDGKTVAALSSHPVGVVRGTVHGFQGRRSLWLRSIHRRRRQVRCRYRPGSSWRVRRDRPVRLSASPR